MICIPLNKYDKHVFEPINLLYTVFLTLVNNAPVKMAKTYCAQGNNSVNLSC